MSKDQQPSQTPNGEAEPLSPGAYRKLIIETSKNMLGILNVELQSLQQSSASPVDQARIILSIDFIAQLQVLAMQAEEQATNLIIAKNPGLVDQDGNPLSRPARRKIDRLVEQVDNNDLADAAQHPDESEFTEVGKMQA